METKQLDGVTLKRILEGGAKEIRQNIQTINDLNVFPVPDGDTGTNMSKTIESGIARITPEDESSLGKVADDFAKGSLLGARGNSGVILSQFFAGLCSSISSKNTLSAMELADAYIEGVKRSYSAVTKPVEGTILTVFRESAEYARSNITEESSLEDFLRLCIDEAERSLKRTKDILPALTEADVVDSGGAGYLCIIRGMYHSLTGEFIDDVMDYAPTVVQDQPDYDLFTADSELEFGYCTECLVRLQNAKCDIAAFDDKVFAGELEKLGCDSIVSLKDGDILKVHAHTKTPSDILILAQKYGEFLNVKIENMSLQHSEKVSAEKKAEKSSVHKQYGVVTVATGDGMTALFTSLGADVIINGGQTGNPSAEQFLEAFESLNVDEILVFPNNSNILLTANQAAELYDGARITVIPTKTIPQGYSALSVFNASITDLDEQISDLTSAKDAVVSGELTVAIRDSSVNGVSVKEGEYIGILDGKLLTSASSPIDAMCDMIESIDDLDEREIITLFVGSGVDDESRVEMTEAIEERFDELTLEVYIGDQEVYDYLIAVE